MLLGFKSCAKKNCYDGHMQSCLDNIPCEQRQRNECTGKRGRGGNLKEECTRRYGLGREGEEVRSNKCTGEMVHRGRRGRGMNALR